MSSRRLTVCLPGRCCFSLRRGAQGTEVGFWVLNDEGTYLRFQVGTHDEYNAVFSLRSRGWKGEPLFRWWQCQRRRTTRRSIQPTRCRPGALTLA
jgi:hypothetical protein